MLCITRLRFHVCPSQQPVARYLGTTSSGMTVERYQIQTSSTTSIYVLCCSTLHGQAEGARLPWQFLRALIFSVTRRCIRKIGFNAHVFFGFSNKQGIAKGRLNEQSNITGTMNMCVVFGSYLARFGFVYWLQSESHIRGDLILGDVHTRGRNTLGSDRTLIVSASPHIGSSRPLFWVCRSVGRHVVLRAHDLRVKKYCRLGIVRTL